jgi:hypothetical protein
VKAVNFFQPPVIPNSHPAPVVALPSDRVPVGNAGLLVLTFCRAKISAVEHERSILPVAILFGDGK